MADVNRIQMLMNEHWAMMNHLSELGEQEELQRGKVWAARESMKDFEAQVALMDVAGKNETERAATRRILLDADEGYCEARGSAETAETELRRQALKLEIIRANASMLRAAVRAMGGE